MIEQQKRSHALADILKPAMLPGDVVLILGSDDSRTTLYGDDYKKAYAENMLTAKHTVPAVIMGFKLLGELMAFHMKYCMPEEYKRIEDVEDKQEEFNAALKSGTLAPENTFRMLSGAYKRMAMLLDGHLAACAPSEYSRMAEAMKGDLSKPMAMPEGGKGGGGGNPS
jgi:hypothetical protein